MVITWLRVLFRPRPLPLPFSSGIMLKDLVAIDAQAKDIMNPVHETLNMAKYRKLWGVLSNIRASQLKPPDTVPDLDKMRVLRVSELDVMSSVLAV